MTHLLAILASMSDSINRITPDLAIIPHDSVSMPVPLLGTSKSLLSPLTAILVLRICYSQCPDEYIKSKLCVRYCMVNCQLSNNIWIKQTIVKIRVSFRQVNTICRFMFPLNQYPAPDDPLQLSRNSSSFAHSQSYTNLMPCSHLNCTSFHD